MHFEPFRVNYIREVGTSEIADFADSLEPYFFQVELRRENFRTAAGGIGTTEAGVIFGLGLAASGFLGEIGKDAYAGVKAGLVALYRRLRTRDTPTGRFQPLGVVVTGEGVEARFVIPEGLSGNELIALLASIPSIALSTVDAQRETPPKDLIQGLAIVEYTYERDKSAWRKSFAGGLWIPPTEPL